MDKKQYDFSGYATKYGVKCADGRTIRKGAFKDNHGTTVPLVWQHLQNDPANILGHAYLEEREDGVYAWAKFNDTPSGVNAKKLVDNGDIKALSIFANDLLQQTLNVVHGVVRELSLVLTGANPGALIENLSISHSDGSDDTPVEDEAIIYTDSLIALFDGKELPKQQQQEPPKKDPVIKHADNGGEEDNETIGQIFEKMTAKEKQVVYAMIAKAVNDGASEDNKTIK